LLLLVGSGLMSRSLDAARGAELGYDPRRVVSTTMDVRQNGYDELRGRAFYQRLLDSARATGGIESATLAAFEPLAFLDTPSRRVEIEGYATRKGEELAFLFNVIAPDYFRTLRIGLVAGRGFEDRDHDTAMPVVIVNRTLAERFWGGASDAVGKRLRVADGDWRTVVGVAADAKYLRVNETPRPYVYLPFLQSYRSEMILHTAAPSNADDARPVPVDGLVEASRALVSALDADLPILAATRLSERMKGALLLFNLLATMLFVFGTTGIALAALGTYGLVSYTVKQSTHDIGIRIALGATGASVVREFVGRGLRLGAIGAALGSLATLAIGGVLQSVLYGVSATDVPSFGRALVIVFAVVFVATLVPAWRASRTNPLTALRHQ